MTLEVSPALVVVLNGDAIVGKALELLLRSTDYVVRFLTPASLKESGMLERVRLVILTPGLSSEERESLLDSVGSGALGKRIPVLELADDKPAGQNETGYVVPWPCRLDDLKLQIREALLAGSEASREGEESQGAPQKQARGGP